MMTTTTTISWGYLAIFDGHKLAQLGDVTWRSAKVVSGWSLDAWWLMSVSMQFLGLIATVRHRCWDESHGASLGKMDEHVEHWPWNWEKNTDMWSLLFRTYDEICSYCELSRQATWSHRFCRRLCRLMMRPKRRAIALSGELREGKLWDSREWWIKLTWIDPCLYLYSLISICTLLKYMYMNFRAIKRSIPATVHRSQAVLVKLLHVDPLHFSVFQLIIFTKMPKV
jgi:hypothetical protein